MSFMRPPVVRAKMTQRNEPTPASEGHPSPRQRDDQKRLTHQQRCFVFGLSSHQSKPAEAAAAETRHADVQTGVPQNGVFHRPYLASPLHSIVRVACRDSTSWSSDTANP